MQDPNESKARILSPKRVSEFQGKEKGNYERERLVTNEVKYKKQRTLQIAKHLENANLFQ